MSSNQLSDVTYAITKFNKTLTKPGQNITLNGSSLTFPVQPAGADGRVASFTISLDTGASYIVSARYFNLTSAQIIIYDAANKAIFNSGTVDVYEGIGD